MEANEADAVDSTDISAMKMIQTVVGKKYCNSLDWLLNRFEQAFEEPLRSHLYNNMELMLTMTLQPGGPSRSLLEDSNSGSIFIWKPEEAKAKFDLVREIKRPLVISKPVSRKRGEELLELVYGTLLVRQRELYPATFGNPEEIYEIPLERGVKVIYWFMKPQHRLPLESGWALLCLKNNIPIGYGGGGLFADHTEIAINVFDTFRGGEAAWLFSQYIRIMYAISDNPWLG
jgi:hypothetical protein